MKPIGHNSGNGYQVKKLLGEMRALRREIQNPTTKTQNALDQVVRLADQEVALGKANERPESEMQNRARGAGFGVREKPSYYSSSIPPNLPAPRPDPNSESRICGPQVVGVPGTPIVSGFLQDLGEYNPQLMGRNAIPTYEKMRREDAQVRATLSACKLPVQSAKWDVVPAEPRQEPGARSQEPEGKTKNQEPRTKNAVSSNGAGKPTAAKAKEVAAFVKENLFGGLEFRSLLGGWATQSWDDVVRNALLMLDFGCAVHEDIWTVDGRWVRLRRMAARLPITFYRWHTDDDGETLLALEQYGYRGGQFLNVLVPADKIAVFTYGQEGANFWGIALQRAIYPHYYVKTGLYRIDALVCERNALGIPVFKLAPGYSKEDHDAAYNLVTQVAAHEATGIVEPPGDPSTGFRLVGYEGRLRDLMPSIQHHNTMISRAALALFMDLGQAEHGSRALGQQHGDFFMLALQNLADQVAMTITNSSVRRLVAYNFGEDAPVPRLVAANVRSRDISELTDSLTRFAQAGLIVSEDNLRRFIREELALPEESALGLVAIRGEAVTPEGEKDTGEVAGKSAEQVAGGKDF